MRMDCRRCPILKSDCQWMIDTFQRENKPPGKADKWCPLLITMGNVLTFLLPEGS